MTGIDGQWAERVSAVADVAKKPRNFSATFQRKKLVASAKSSVYDLHANKLPAKRR
jgi:hypothetical protein